MGGAGWGDNAAALSEQAGQVAAAVHYAGYFNYAAAYLVDDGIGEVRHPVGPDARPVFRPQNADVGVFGDYRKPGLDSGNLAVGDFISGGCFVIVPYLRKVS